MKTTNTNLMYAEAMINNYLHEHSTDASEVLWVTNEGIRLPHKRSHENLEENMKYLETQLEKYLHEHKTVTTGEAGAIDSGDLSIVKDFAFPGDTGNYIEYGGDGFLYSCDPFDDVVYKIDPVNGLSVNSWAFPQPSGLTQPGDLAWDHDNDTLWMVLINDDVIVQLNPANGTQISSIPTATAANGIAWGNGSLYSVSFSTDTIYELDPSDGSVLSTVPTPNAFPRGSAYTTIAEAPVLFNMDVPNGIIYLIDLSDGSAIATWDAGGLIGNTNGWLSIAHEGSDVLWAVNSSNPSHVYRFAFTLPEDTEETTLQITPVGFRFPYRWDQKGAIEQNMHYLEAQISQYLHSHEEGVA